MAYKKKYSKGKQITSFDELLKQEFVYVNGKITHIGWVMNWQISLAQLYLERGALYRAERREEND